MTKRAATIAKYLVPLLVGFFIARVIYRNWQQVQEADWTFEPVYLLAGSSLTACWFLLRPWVWAWILACFDHPLSYHAAFRIMRQAELSRYVPGTIWQYLSRVYLAGLWGVSAASTLAASLLETVLLLLAAMLPALWSLGASSPILGRHQRILLAVVPLVAFAAIHPRVLNWWAAWLSKRLKQPYTRLNIRWRAMVAVWAGYLALWLVHGLAVALFVRGVMRVPADSIILIPGEYVLAWLVGMISMIAPAGMGVRDGAFGLLLARRLPLGAALTLAVAVRLWLTLMELIYTLGGQLLIQRAGLASPESAAGIRRKTS